MRIREVQMMTIYQGIRRRWRRLRRLARGGPCKQTPWGWGWLASATTCGWRDRGKTAALSPRTEIDFLSIHSTAQMSSFDNCCVIECAEYWRVSSSGPRTCLGCLALWLHHRKAPTRKSLPPATVTAPMPLKSSPVTPARECYPIRTIFLVRETKLPFLTLYWRDGMLVRGFIGWA